MTEQNVVESAPVGDGKTSDQILSEIEAAQRQLESQGPAKPEGQEPKPAGETEQVEPNPSDKPSETSETSESGEEVPAPQGSDKSGEVEELMKKKGFKTIDDIVRSYRNLERKMHGQGRVQQPQALPPMAQPSFQAPNPEYRPMPSRGGIQELAEKYQMTVEDIQKIAQLSNDIAEFKIGERITPIVEQFTNLKRDYDKDASFKRIERDPLFRSREVQLEMHKLAEEDPSVLEQPDYPERLFDRALSRIGRRFAEGSVKEESSSGSNRLGIPSNPPPSGRGSAGGPKGVPLKPPTSITSRDFNKLSVAEMEKELRKRGAFREPY